MKRIILILLTTVAFGSCIDENTDGCPADMLLAFYLHDDYESGDYDSKVGNDVALYIFKDKKLSYSNIIPYSEIQGGKEYAIRKTPEIAGNLELIAWAVPLHGDNSLIPQYQIGDLFDYQFMEHAAARAEERLAPICYDIHLGNVSSVEAINKPTSHLINMPYAPCRVEVRIHDASGEIDASQPDKPPHVLVSGVMSQMNLHKQGVGNPAVVKVPLSSDDGETYATGRFGVLPSSEGQTVSVQVIGNDNVMATLTVPENNLPKGAESGGLLIFEYALGETSFTITINDFTQKIEIVNGI